MRHAKHHGRSLDKKKRPILIKYLREKIAEIERGYKVKQRKPC